MPFLKSRILKDPKKKIVFFCSRGRKRKAFWVRGGGKHWAAWSTMCRPVCQGWVPGSRAHTPYVLRPPAEWLLTCFSSVSVPLLSPRLGQTQDPKLENQGMPKVPARPLPAPHQTSGKCALNVRSRTRAPHGGVSHQGSICLNWANLWMESPTHRTQWWFPSPPT